MSDDKILSLLVSEVQNLRLEIRDMRKDIYKELNKSNRAIQTLRLKFVAVALVMGLAGGKVSTLIPFLR